jgi:hypothetical protein
MTNSEHIPNEAKWKCCGCGVISPNRVRSCACPTECLYQPGHLNLSALKLDAAMDIFMTWVNQGPALAKAAGVYVGIKVYPSEAAARKAGDIS